MRLSEEEIRIAERFRSKVERNGVGELARWEFESGMNNYYLTMKIFEWLKEQKWYLIDSVIAMDTAIVDKMSKLDDMYSEKKKEITFDAALNRRISNAFDLSEIRRLGIKHMKPEVAEMLVRKREQERMNGR